MEINTKYFGQIEIEEIKKIIFSRGLPAFEKLTQFTLLDLDDNGIFKTLQSLEEKDIAFLTITPWHFFPDYDIKIPEEDLKSLGIEKMEEVAIYNIVTLSKDQDKMNMTANLLAPIVINLDRLLGKQIILTHEEYHTKHPLVEKKEV